MRAVELIRYAYDHPERRDLAVASFLDDFRCADAEAQHRAIRDAPDTAGPIEGLVAAVVSALCRECNLAVPEWVRETGSPEPYFPTQPRSTALRLRLMIESPAPFKTRSVFVPENYMSRA